VIGEAAAAASNLYATTVGGGLADLRRMPSTVIDTGPQRTLSRYDSARRRRGAPVILVPPLAAPAICFDLRRGCSLAEHLVVKGRRTYLLEYGAINFADRELGLEHWIEDVIPTAIRAAAEDAGRPVHALGWCLGGIMTLLAHAMDGDLPVERIALVASPFDFSKVPLIAPLRPYPGRTFGQLYHRFFRTNDLADGRLALTDRTIDLADATVPLLAVAGRGEGIAPVAACLHVADLVGAAPIELETAPGGHLGVLTGRAARDTTWKLLDAFL
jgi:poly(3-hydroxyalkanoate) synthetase